MGLSFFELWEKVELLEMRTEDQKDNPESLLGSGDESPAMQVVRHGMNLSSDDYNFWDDFLNLVNNNTDGVADLLDIQREKVGLWSGKINELIEKIKNVDSRKNDKKRSEVISTGNRGPIADQNAGETAPSDTRPMI